MPRLVAFLRGINLGGRRLEMDELRGHFEAFGLENVATFIASGNVIFDPPETDPATLEREIADHLADTVGFSVRTFIRPLAELDRLVGSEAVAAARDDGFTPYAVFLREAADARVEEALDALATADDRFHVVGRDVVWFRRGRLKESTIATRDLERALGGSDSTMRNVNTVQRIVSKFGA